MTQPVTALAATPTEMPIADVAQAAADRAAHYAAHAFANATQRAYRNDWRCWQEWCDQVGTVALPADPAAVAAYLAQLADTKSISTVTRRLAAISTAHRVAGHRLDTGHPALRNMLRGLKRERGTAPMRRARAVTTPLLRQLVETCDETMLGLRDRAVLLTGFASALRRSEVAALDMADIEFAEDGVRLHIRRSKTDAEGHGAVVGVVRTDSPNCPVKALQAWLQAAGIGSGRVFRRVDRHGRVGDGLTGEAVAMAVQRRAQMAGLNPVEFSAHSLRAGLITSAAAAGLAELDIARQSRHKSLTVLRGYVRPGSVFLRNVSGGVGL